MFEVRATSDRDGVRQRAIYGIGQYFGAAPTEERLERFSKVLPHERMHAALDGRPDRRRRRRVPVRAVGAGRHARRAAASPSSASIRRIAAAACCAR